MINFKGVVQEEENIIIKKYYLIKIVIFLLGITYLFNINFSIFKLIY
jgi:hypothetical protein